DKQGKNLGKDLEQLRLQTECQFEPKKKPGSMCKSKLASFALSAKLMPLFQDRVDGEFYVLDGESLLMEAAATVGWQYGQQLHLFYLAESILKLLKDHGGDCQVVYFNSFFNDPLMDLFRRAMQLHLDINCSVPVHTELAKSCFDPAWLNYLKEEKPLFFMLHDGVGYGKSTKQRLLALSSLACRVPVAYISSLRQNDMKLHASCVQWMSLDDRLFKKQSHKDVQLSKVDETDDEAIDIDKSFESKGTAKKSVEDLNTEAVADGTFKYESYASKISIELQKLNSAHHLNALPLLPLSISKQALSQEPINEQAVETAPLQRIDNRLLKEFAGKILDKLGSSGCISLTNEAGQNSAMLFDERWHWHVNRELRDDLEEQDEPELSSNPILRKIQLKKIQQLQNHISMYGKSLHGETSETIVLSTSSGGASAASASGGEKPNQQKQKQPKGKSKPVSKADVIKEENLRAKADKDMKKLKEQWKNLLLSVKKLEPTQAIAKATRMAESCTVQDRIFEEPVLFVMREQYTLWKTSCASSGCSGRSFSALADLVQTLHKYTTEPLDSIISSELRVKIAELFIMVGFKEAAAVSSVDAERLKNVQVEKECICPLNYRDFQMQHMGHLMQRNVRFDPDPRVKGFIPDTWQRELLDVVDRRESAVIVAPTSSGKTFCSYYCMKKVLEMSDEAVAVYVAPTKALVNQVQASISAKFSKPNLTPGMELCGVFTRDYNHKATSCQILVTVPQCLELLLLSPRRQGWASRIRYVIFDEVHCIGTGIGGIVWEYLLCLIRCPFLALSATISNKDYFHDWLQTIKQFVQVQDSTLLKQSQPMQPKHKKQQRQKGVALVAVEGYKVNLVTYSERYSDIRTSVYLPKSGCVAEVNPCAFLSDKLLRINGFPRNLKLSPKESTEVWSAALKCFADDPAAVKALQKFKPESFFGNKPITRTQFRELEVDLKRTVSELLRQSSQAKSTQLLTTIQLNDDQQNVTQQFEFLSDVDIISAFPDLIDRLHSQGRLPALVFMNDRKGIEKLAASLVDRANERIKQAVDPKLLERMEKARKAMAIAHKRNRDKDDSDDENPVDAAERESYYRHRLELRSKIQACAYFKPQAVQESFLKEVLKPLNENVTNMIEFGVCYHHAGCSAKHRQAVEMLFRSGHLQVVTATATLALGVHMPCKTVVFASDDKFLDALNYHQMAGRSGRRGFDNIGNIVFYGVPASKIAHLIQADLPELKGGFPLTCAFVLRLLLLTGNATDPEVAHNQAATVLEHPFAAHQRPDMMQQLRLFFLFSAEFLYRQDLINELGAPLDLAGLVCHMGYLQPGNFVLTYLLRTPALRQLCEPASNQLPPIHYELYCVGCQTDEPIVGQRFKCTKCWSDYSLCASCYSGRPNHNRGRQQHTANDFELQLPPLRVQFSDKTLRKLVRILCHLFTKVDLPRYLVKRTADGTLHYVRPTENSKVLLKPLPNDIESAVRDYNSATAVTYTNYLRCTADSGLLKFSTALPFSQSAPIVPSSDRQLQ
uniref:Helicase ATP-binding domain-containing protein n=1 Tax=Macrostomum lignano TaxID=282301 RepID=A0A1I8FWF1_9PLAT